MALPELPDDRRARPQRYTPGALPPGRHAVRTPPGGQAATNGSAAPHGPLRNKPGDVPRGSAPPRGNGSANGEAVNGRSRPTNRHPSVPPPRRPGSDDEPTVVHSDLAHEVPAHVDEPVPSAENYSSGAPSAETASPETEPAGVDADDVPGRHRRRAGEWPGSRPAAQYKAQAEAARNGKKVRPGRRRRENFWRELPLLVVVALLLTFLIQTFVAKVYVIPSGSMELTLNGCTGCNNDRVLVDKVTYRFTDPSPGDVVVFRGPDSWSSSENFVPTSSNALVNGLQQFGSLIGMAPPDEKDFVKRVIAVGGQTVQCCDSGGRVVVDGEPLDEPYLYFVPGSGIRQDAFDAVTVPEGQLWMMGDSRNNSADSRAPGHGPVPVENVIGQARVIVLPLPRFGWLPSIDPQPSDAVAMGADSAGAPVAIGLLGVFPLAVWRRRLAERSATFLP